jgi:hypothetical protein
MQGNLCVKSRRKWMQKEDKLRYIKSRTFYMNTPYGLERYPFRPRSRQGRSPSTITNF